jgi:hypothetical protein
VTGDDLAQAQARIAQVNRAVRSVFEHVAGVALVGGAPWPGTGKWYGPSERCTVEVSPCPENASATFRLWVGNAIGRGGAFVLQAKAPAATDDAYRTVLAGWMRRGALARRGAGQIWVNLEALKLAASAFPGQGRLFGGFGAGPVAKTAAYVLSAFTPDTGKWAPATVAFRGFKTAAGTARVRVAAIRDLVQTTADTELGLAHVVYNSSLGGRAFAIVSNYRDAGVSHGDVPADAYFLGRACYAAGAPQAPVFKQWFLCPGSEGPVACIADTGNPSKVELGTSWDADCAALSQAAFQPPTSAPGTDPAAQPGQLPGEEVEPEAVPTTDAAAPAPS